MFGACTKVVATTKLPISTATAVTSSGRVRMAEQITGTVQSGQNWL